MIIFITVWSIWCASEVLLNILLRSGKDDKKNQDKGSIVIIWLMVACAIGIGVTASIITPYEIGRNAIVPLTGLGIIVTGMLIRYIAIKSLGNFFTVDITIRQNHHIKKDGMYSHLRHPSYASSLLSFIGFGMSLNNWVSLAVVTIFIFIAFSYRISVEEKMLLQQFGDEYRNYMKTTCRVIPYIY